MQPFARRLLWIPQGAKSFIRTVVCHRPLLSAIACVFLWIIGFHQVCEQFRVFTVDNSTSIHSPAVIHSIWTLYLRNALLRYHSDLYRATNPTPAQPKHDHQNILAPARRSQCFPYATATWLINCTLPSAKVSSCHSNWNVISSNFPRATIISSTSIIRAFVMKL